jgi:hypothetical protein
LARSRWGDANVSELPLTAEQIEFGELVAKRLRLQEHVALAAVAARKALTKSLSEYGTANRALWAVVDELIALEAEMDRKRVRVEL